MASLRKVPYTKPLPAGAEVVPGKDTLPIPTDAEIIERQGRRFARYTERRGNHVNTILAPLTPDGRAIQTLAARLKNRQGKTVQAPVFETEEDGRRIRLESRKWYGEYRDASDQLQCVPLSANKEAAQRMLQRLVDREEDIRSGLLTRQQSNMVDYLKAPIGSQFDEYFRQHPKEKVTAKRKQEARHHLDTIAAACGFARLADLRAEPFEGWLAEQEAAGMSARTRNAYRESLVAFCNWCKHKKRLPSNPFSDVPKANVKLDPRHPRRAMSEDELLRLLAVARHRPLLEARTVRCGDRKGELSAEVKPTVRERLDLIGWERYLIYKTLVLTGLRKGELASLMLAQLHLDGPAPHAKLKATDAKSRKKAEIALRADLVADLREWLTDRLRRLQLEAQQHGKSIPIALPGNMKVFHVPAKLYAILNRDLEAAGIPKRNDLGEVLDVHALRKTFGTLLSVGGVQPRVAQDAMRHSTIDLTMNVYTDPRLLDVHGAVCQLPALPAPSVPDADSTESLREACAKLAGTAAKDQELMRRIKKADEEGDKAGNGVSAYREKERDSLGRIASESPVYPHGDSNPGLLAENQTS